MITFALPKGRLAEKSAEMLSACGVDTAVLREDDLIPKKPSPPLCAGDGFLLLLLRISAGCGKGTRQTPMFANVMQIRLMMRTRVG